MNILDNLGISYKAGYLIQGNQIERCNISNNLNVRNTELMMRTDGKDSNIEKILKNYKGNIVFHVPAINPDLSNLDTVNNLVRDLKKHNIKLVTIDASNLSSDLFEWSTLEEQKKYFLNIVTAIATLASNKIEVAVQNLKQNDPESKFGSSMGQITDIIIYARRLLDKDFGLTKEESEKYVGISLNIDNIDFNNDNNSIINYFEVFGNYIKCIKIRKKDNLKEVIDFLKEKQLDIPLFMQTKSDLDEIKNEYTDFENEVLSYLGEEKPVRNKEKKNTNNKGFSNILIATMIILTIVIVILMFIVKLR